MRKKEIKTGMELCGYSPVWGEFRIKVIEITTDKPARIEGIVLDVIKPSNVRDSYSAIGKVFEFGIINVSIKTDAEIQKIKDDYKKYLEYKKWEDEHKEEINMRIIKYKIEKGQI